MVITKKQDRRESHPEASRKFDRKITGTKSSINHMDSLCHVEVLTAYIYYNRLSVNKLIPVTMVDL